MSIKELLERIEKLQRRWTHHAVEHREKRNNNNPNYNAYDHGVATGYLKALNTFKDWARRLDTLPEADLDAEFERFLNDVEGVPRMYHSDEQIEWGKDLARHFAEWGAEHLKRNCKN